MGVRLGWVWGGEWEGLPWRVRVGERVSNSRMCSNLSSLSFLLGGTSMLTNTRSKLIVETGVGAAVVVVVVVSIVVVLVGVVDIEVAVAFGGKGEVVDTGVMVRGVEVLL